MDDTVRAYPRDPATGRAVLGGCVDDRTASVILERQFERDLTCGDWATEAESEAELDRRLNATNLWTIYRQVEGRPYAQAPTDDVKGYRIDRVVFPTLAARLTGWDLGPIGIECKRSGIKIGKPISQALDYRRAFWHLDSSPESWFTLGFVFVWPIHPQGGPIASVMAQNRVGSAFPTDADGDGVSLGVGSQSVRIAGRNVDLRRSLNAIGRKNGSR